MIIWRGWGILVIFITGGVLFLSTAIADELLGSMLFRQYESIVSGVALLVAALLIGVIGYALNDPDGRTVIHPQTNLPVVLPARHRLYFINMEYWSIVVALYGLYKLAQPILSLYFK